MSNRPLQASSSTNNSRSASVALGMRTSSLSRVNSLTRNWGDDHDSQGKDKHQGKVLSKGANLIQDSDEEEEVQWSPSPDYQAMRAAGSAATADTAATAVAIKPKHKPAANPVEEAKAKRRAAILAALQGDLQASAPSTTPSSTSYDSAASYNRLKRAGVAVDDRGLLAAGPGPGSMASASKRLAPWAADSMRATKRSMSDESNASTSSSIAGANANKSLNVKQKLLLSNEQQQVLQMVVAEGKSLFFTGSAGTGKSVLLREIIASLKKKHHTNPDAVAVTASTGIAACNIGGVTLHSFGGIGLGLETPEQMVAKIKKNRKAAARWARTKVLIIDEISMIDAALFDKLNRVAKLLRKKPAVPWGGIQVILTGDFFQLPPVTRDREPTFAFEAETWDETISCSFNLTKVFRQKDQMFVDMLNEMRFGKLSPRSIAEFRKLDRPLTGGDTSIDATELFPMRHSVESANKARNDSLPTERHTYVATDGPAESNAMRDKLLENFMAVPELSLCVHSQVMLIKNLDESLVNGSMGRVVGFVHKHLYREDTAGKWIGKAAPEESDGEEDLSEVGGQKLKAKKKKMELVNSKPLPVVRFRLNGGGTRDMLVDYDSFTSELPNGEVVASRLQLPLILAWAMSIHKSQGQTLDKVKVDLTKVFEKGQAYVALSRATSLQGLHVVGFKPDKVMAHPKVIAWSKKLITYNHTN